MANLNNRGRYVQIIALVQPSEALMVVRVELRDYQYRLIARRQFSPGSVGSTERCLELSIKEWDELLWNELTGPSGSVVAE